MPSFAALNDPDYNVGKQTHVESLGKLKGVPGEILNYEIYKHRNIVSDCKIGNGKAGGNNVITQNDMKEQGVLQ